MKSHYDVVIVGAGPIGLYTAIKLKQKGVNVAVIDDRLGDYTRPGVLDRSVFDNIEANLQMKLEYSSSRHIKDVERGLYKLALKTGVTLHRFKFTSIQANGITVADQTQATKKINCDVVLDSTGGKRAVVNYVNSTSAAAKKPFVIEPAADNPLKQHLIAYVTMSNADVEALSKKGSAAVRALAMEEMRTKYGWTGYSEPTFYYQSLHKQKICIYIEMPTQLGNEINHLKSTLKTTNDANAINSIENKITELQTEWLMTSLKAKTGNPNISFQQIHPSKKRGKKPRFITFDVDPKLVKTVAHEKKGETPLIIPIGDAQIEPDYRIGLGIASGIKRANTLINAINVNNSEQRISVNTTEYEFYVQQPIAEHKTNLDHLYSDRWSSLVQLKALEEKEELYKKALNEDISDPQRLIIEYGLKAINIEKLLASAKKSFDEKKYSDAIELYHKIIALCATLVEKEEIKKGISANSYKQQIFSKWITGYANLVLCYKLNKEYENAITCANQVLVLFNKVITPEQKNKINYNKCHSLMMLAEQQIESNALDDAAQYLKQAKKTLDENTSPPGKLTQLTKHYQMLTGKLGEKQFNPDSGAAPENITKKH